MGYRQYSQLNIESRLNKLEKENKKLQDEIQELKFKNGNTIGYIKSNNKIINKNFNDFDKFNKTTSKNFKNIEQFQIATVKKINEQENNTIFLMIAIAIVCVIQIAQNF